MRVRISELMRQHGLTAYAVARASQGRISNSTAYRLQQTGGRLQRFDSDMLDALCDIFGVGPGDLFEYDSRPRSRKLGR